MSLLVTLSLVIPILQAFSITFFGEWGDKSQVSFASDSLINCHIFGTLFSLLSSLSYVYRRYICMTSLIYMLCILPLHTLFYMDSDSYHWFSCRWEPIRCCSRWNSVSNIFIDRSLLIVGKLFFWWPNDHMQVYSSTGVVV